MIAQTQKNDQCACLMWPSSRRGGCEAWSLSWRRERDSNPRSFRSVVFKTTAFGRSAIPPRSASGRDSPGILARRGGVFNQSREGRGGAPLNWKTNPPTPPCQGGKSDAPDEGFFNSPEEEDWGVCGGAHFPAFAAGRSSLPFGVRAKFSASRSKSTRICPQLPSRRPGRGRV